MRTIGSPSDTRAALFPGCVVWDYFPCDSLPDKAESETDAAQAEVCNVNGAAFTFIDGRF